MVAAVIVMVIFFLGIPVLLGVLVHRAARKSKKRGRGVMYCTARSQYKTPSFFWNIIWGESVWAITR